MYNRTHINQLKTFVDPGHWLEGTSDQAQPYLQEWRGRYQGNTPLILFPKTTQHVSELMKFCHAKRIKVTPQGGNTGLVGGQIPQGEVLLCLEKMKAIRQLSETDLSVIVEAGLSLSDLQNTLQSKGLFFPITLASESQAQFGGLISTNAGGAHVIRFGMMQDQVLGLEVVLADGRIWTNLGLLYKDNAGYDLKQIFIGSEGTLGLITAASLKVYAKPAERLIVWAGLEKITDILTVLSHCRKAYPNTLYAFEILPQTALDLVLKHIPGTRAPLTEVCPWHVLLEFGFDHNLSGRRSVEIFLSSLFDKRLIKHAVLAESTQQENAFFKLRESLSEAQKKEGSSLKHDLSLPVSKLAEFMEKAGQIVQKTIPGAQPLPFGHAGDGNLHFNVLQPKNMETPLFLEFREPLAQALNDLVTHLQGSIAAEHGIGLMKKTELARLKSAQDLALMKALKQKFDPENILNPRILF